MSMSKMKLRGIVVLLENDIDHSSGLFASQGCGGPQAPALFLFCCSFLPAELAKTSNKKNVLGGLRPPNLPAGSLQQKQC
jgi:hypothetical protein